MATPIRPGSHTDSSTHGWRRGLRWTRRIVLGLLALVALVVVAALAFIHTDAGREEVRVRVEDQLQDTFTGGATIGKLEGSPFGDLVLRDFVINGPDGRPAITIGTLRTQIRIFDLLKRDIRLDHLIVEHVEATLKQNPDGTYQLAQLLKPAQEPTGPSRWTIVLPEVTVRDAHVLLETRDPELQTVNLDDVAIDASALLPPADDAKHAALRLTGTWRERNAPLEVDASIADDGAKVVTPTLKVAIGGVVVTGTNLAVTRRPDRAPLIEGLVHVLAKRADAAALDRRVELLDDVDLTLSATIDGGQRAKLAGTFGPSPITGDVAVDLDTQHHAGTLEVGELQLARLTRGRVAASVAGKATFELRQGAPGALPTLALELVGHGTYEELPRSDFTLKVTTAGHHISTALDVTGAQQAKLRAELDKVADAVTLQRASLVASTTNPARASGGRAPVRGALKIDLHASGALAPQPALAVHGTIAGTRLITRDLSIASVDVAIDAAQLPSSPTGRATVRVRDLVKGETRLRALDVDAATRADGKLQASVTSRPAQDPWLVELAALITPPGRGATTTIELQRHRLRVANGADWRGTGGRIVIGPEVVDVRDLRSASADGKLAIEAAYVKAGRHTGDLTAKVDLDRFALESLQTQVSGLLDAHVDLARRAGAWRGTVELAGKKLIQGVDLPGPDAVTAEAHLKVSPSQLLVDARLATLKDGVVKLGLDLVPPARLEDVAAWQRRGREALTKARLELSRVDLAKVAARLPTDQVAITHGPQVTRIRLLGRPFDVSGTIDGAVELDRTTATGRLAVRGLHLSPLRGVKAIDADLALAQPKLGELTPTVAVRIAEVGNAVATARLALPARLFDPEAWAKLGVDAVQQASVHTEPVAIDPAMLARLGITSTLRGKAKLDVEIGRGLETIDVRAVADEVRGIPIAQPVSIRAEASIDRRQARASIAMTSQGKPLTLLRFDGTVPITVARLRSEEPDLATLALTGKLTIPSTSAPQLLGVFGRSEIVAGTVDGTVELGGTIGKPRLVAKLAGHDLAPRPIRARRLQTIKTIAVDARYTAAGATLKIDGVEDRGGTLAVRASAAPGALARGTATIRAKNFDTGALLAFAPGPAGGAEGTLDADLKIAGFDPEVAKILGELHVKHARIPLAPQVGTLRKAAIDVQIRDHDVVLGATGKLGAGELKASGTIALDGVSLSGGQVKLTLREVSPIGTIEPQISADIDAKITRKQQVWTADVVIAHGSVKVEKRDGERLKEIGLPADLTIGPRPRREKTKPGPPKRASLIANITLEKTRVESKEARTTVSGKLTLTADGDAIGAVGSIGANSGDVDLFDRRYRLERGAVTFDGTIDPRLDVRISHDFPDVTTVTVVRGRLSKPELELSANPGQYTQAQLLGFLLGGEPGGDPSSGSARDKATSAGTSLVANQLAGYVRDALPFDVDVLRYEAAGVGSSASITVGTWLTHSLFFAFRQHLEALPDENSGEGTLEYWLTRQLQIQGTAGDRGYNGVDILWRKRF